MNTNLSTPWVVAAIVAVVLIIGVIIWRMNSPAAPAPTAGPPGGGPGGIAAQHPGYPPPTPLPPGGR